VDFDTANRVEVPNPRVNRNPVRVQIVENHVADPYAKMPAILRDCHSTTIITQADHEVAASLGSDLNDFAGIPGTLQSRFDLICALLALQYPKSTGCGRRNH
jgi:hypothetical protein